MNKMKKLVPLLASASALLVAAMLVVGAAAAPDPFKGKWTSVDIDGSNQTLLVGGGPAGSYHVRYHDDGATVCAADLSIAASAVGALGSSGDTISGLMPVYCLASPRYLYDLDSYFQYTYYPATDTLVDQHGTVWSH